MVNKITPLTSYTVPVRRRKKASTFRLNIDNKNNMDTSRLTKTKEMEDAEIKIQNIIAKLSRYNLWAAIAHLLNFVILLGLTIDKAKQSFVSEITTDFMKYVHIDITNSSGYTTILQSQSTIRIAWLQLAFPFITSFFHFFIWFKSKDIYFGILRARVNPYRWIEYGITATIMFFNIMQLCGITNVFLLLICGIFMSILLQYSGYIIERIDAANYHNVSLRLPNFGIPIGWSVFIIQWVTVTSYFFEATLSKSVPWFVYTVVITMFIMFSSFGVIQMLYIYNSTKSVQEYAKMEMRYILLSFASKLSLDWIVMLGILTSSRTL